MRTTLVIFTASLFSFFACQVKPGGVDDLNFLLPKTTELQGADALDYFRMLPEEQYRKAHAHYLVKEAYQRRRSQSLARLGNEMRVARSRQIITGAIAAGTVNAALARIVKSPKKRHLLAQAGVIGGTTGGLAAGKIITRITRSIQKKVRVVNDVAQLTDEELYRYMSNLQPRVRIRKIGIPRPFGNGDERMLIPKKLINLILEFQSQTFPSKQETTQFLRTGLDQMIKKYISGLHTIYNILRTTSAFLWTSAGMSALDLPKTHRDLIEFEQARAG